MTTDIRAALRAAVLILLDPVLRNDENTRVGAAERFRALADAPPTVAELLPRVDAGHRLEWTDEDGDDRIAKLDGTVIRSYFRSPGMGDDAWSPIGLLHTDTTCHARLVEVTP